MQVDPQSYGTDKPPAYLENYEREFGERFEDPIALLELGVQRGGSMRLWLDLLPNAVIAGLDLNAVDIDDDSGRLHIYQGFQQDPAILDRIGTDVAPDGFDVIVDDASHIGRYTAESFWHLFLHHLKPGGVYVIDDWCCAYRSNWVDGHSYVGSRSSLGDFKEHAPDRDARTAGIVENTRRKVRASARPVAARLRPSVRKKIEKLYMRLEGSTLMRRFPSHDYGMAGFIKQLVDASAIHVIDGDGNRQFDNGIASIHIYKAQVFVHKKS